jgi:predicted GNAT family acetyltransferase
MNLKEKNIENILSLWTIVNTPFNTNYNKGNYSYCYLPFSDWPNRLWSWNFTPEVLDDAIKEMRNGKEGLRISSWEDNHDLFLSRDLEQRFQQTGMSLHLKERPAYEKRLQLMRVENEEQAKQWVDTFTIPFGYRIHEDLVAQSCNKVQFNLVFFENTLIGTALLHIEDGIAGIHSVGIIPEVRRKGYAEEIMKILIDMAIDSNASHCVLQASEMGQGIYTRLGFTADFLFTHYTLPVNK